MAGFETSRFCRESCTAVRAREDRGTEYVLRCGDGEGRTVCYEVFPGVELCRHHYQAHACREAREQAGLLELNFCVSGRFECAFTPRECVILGPGDLSAHRFDGLHGADSRAEFPLGYYEGIGLVVDCGPATDWAARHFSGAPLDFGRLCRQLLPDRWYRVSRAGERCGPLLRALYEGAPTAAAGRLRLQVMELCWLLQELPPEEEPAAYFSREQVELVKRVRDRIVQDRAGYTSVERLAREYGISVSQLQKVFRGVYGRPIYAYLREYRLEQAAVALQKTGRCVTDIALEAGFANPSKFSESFRRRYGISPTEYRSRCKWQSETE